MSTYFLRKVTTDDSLRLYELLSLPLVCEYLSDGVAPERVAVDGWVAAAITGNPPLGLWLLEDAEDQLLGCVRLSAVEDGAASAELTYVLHPTKWGKGLATVMSRTVISQAFGHESCESIVAGADVANSRSVRLMQRLGMQRLRRVDYPAGPGVEYHLTRSQFASMPPGDLLPIRQG